MVVFMYTHFVRKLSNRSGPRFSFLRKLINKIWHGIRHTKIQTRLMISFILLSSIPLFVTGYFSYHNSSNTIRDKISAYSLMLMNQIGKNIDDQLVRLINDSIAIEFTDDMSTLFWTYFYRTIYLKMCEFICNNNIASLALSRVK